MRHIVKNGDEAVEIDFLYLDRGGDGIVVEVFHTKPKQIKCSGIIMGTDEIGYIGEFLPRRPPTWMAVAYAMMFVGPAGLLYIVFRDMPTEFIEPTEKFLLIAASILTLTIIVS